MPRPLRVIRFDEGAPAPGTAVLDADGTSIGTVTSSSLDVALAPVARKVAPGDVVTAGAAGRGVVLAPT